MEIRTGQHLGLEAAGAPTDRVCERQRTRRVDDARTSLEPRAVEDAVARRAERSARQEVAFSFGLLATRGRRSSLSSSGEEPPQFIRSGWAERTGVLLLPRPFVGILGLAEVTGDPQANHPSAERSQQLGMTKQERPEVHRVGPRHEAPEDVLATRALMLPTTLVSAEASERR